MFYPFYKVQGRDAGPSARRVGLDTSGNTGANALVGSGAVSVFQRAQHCPLGPGSRALCKPALVAEVGGHLPGCPGTGSSSLMPNLPAG